MNTFPPSRRWVVIVAAVLLSIVSPVTGRTAESIEAAPANRISSEAVAPDLFQRIVLLGASATDGFTGSEPFGGPKSALYRFENYIEAALSSRHEPVKTHAQRFLFLNPVETMKKQVAATLGAKPSLVIALDALFWFSYGNGLNAEARLKRFDLGLELISQIDAPLVIGDIPDASRAVGKILGKADMPDLATIAECNERLRAWAATRKNVTIFPLAELMKKAGADEDLSISGISWAAGTTKGLLQGDNLHPSRHGLAGLAITALSTAAAASNLPLEGTGLLLDPEVVYRAGIAAGEARLAEQKAKTPAAASKE